MRSSKNEKHTTRAALLHQMPDRDRRVQRMLVRVIRCRIYNHDYCVNRGVCESSSSSYPLSHWNIRISETWSVNYSQTSVAGTSVSFGFFSDRFCSISGGSLAACKHIANCWSTVAHWSHQNDMVAACIRFYHPSRASFKTKYKQHSQLKPQRTSQPLSLHNLRARSRSRKKLIIFKTLLIKFVFSKICLHAWRSRVAFFSSQCLNCLINFCSDPPTPFARCHGRFVWTVYRGDSD